MANYAKVVNGIVTEVIVAEPEFFDTFIDSSPGDWIETSHDIRNYYAGIGFTYDKIRDIFIEPQTHPNWILNEETFHWEAPVPYPTDGKPNGDKQYYWDESSNSWKEHVEA